MPQLGIVVRPGVLVMFEMQRAIAADRQSDGPERQQVCQKIIQPPVMRQGEMRAVMAEDRQGVLAVSDDQKRQQPCNRVGKYMDKAEGAGE